MAYFSVFFVLGVVIATQYQIDCFIILCYVYKFEGTVRPRSNPALHASRNPEVFLHNEAKFQKML